MSMHRSRTNGFSLIELMVVIAIIGIGLALGAPYLAGASRASKERGLIARMQQDFAWARTASGYPDASKLNASATGIPVIKIKLETWCGWTTTINGYQDPIHTMPQAQVSSTLPGMTCPTDTSNTLTLPATFTFSAQGTMDTSGVYKYVSTSGTIWPLIFLISGTVLLNTNGTLS